MKIHKRTKRILTALILALSLVASVVIIYLGSIPRTYDLHVGDTSLYDISAPRAIIDKAETEKRAREAVAQVPTVILRSDAKSEESINAEKIFFNLVDTTRAELYPEEVEVETEPSEADENETNEENPSTNDRPRNTRRPSKSAIEIAASSLISACDQTLNIVIPSGDAETLMRIDRKRLDSIMNIMKTESKAMVLKSLDDSTLLNELNESKNRITEQLNFNEKDADLIVRLLSLIIEPNVEYDVEATENAQQAAYEQVINNPVMINRGSRILTAGEVVTEDVMAKLQALDLIDDSEFDWITLVSISILVILSTVLGWFYFSRYKSEIFDEPRNLIALLLTVLLTLLVSFYLSNTYILAPPVYFAAVVITAYFGFRTAVVFCFLLVLLISPMIGFEPAFALIAMSGSIVAALTTKGISRQDNYAKIILATSINNFLLTVLIGLMEKEPWALISNNVVQTVMSGLLSVIVAIGIMPLYEMIFNTISPLRLIELSQSGHPLMKRLFVEAPGTYQHSLMVANLADSAAEAIGANPMIARIGSYYHDIGKLEAPLYFTENQKDENPHDYITPKESAEIITRHPQDSMRIGKKYRLPMPILRIANEHHGSTVLRYFYHKACEEADSKGEKRPSDQDFRYKTPIPSTPEAAIVMLADSTEAAMHSSGITDIDEAEKLLRSVIKEKVDQGQLINSGLSFANVEVIIDSFLQVYAGHFHERIEYPSADTDTQEA